jgi:hypothetical protein
MSIGVRPLAGRQLGAGEKQAFRLEFQNYACVFPASAGTYPYTIAS